MISIELNVDRQLLLDILSDGMDYVCRGYWGQIEKYKWYWWYICDKDGEPISDWPDNPTYGYRINPEIDGDTVLVKLRDDEDGYASVKRRPWVGITLNKLEEAFGWALKNYPHTIVPYEIDENTITECNYDAVTADVILQRIVFGEVVYG